jgi:hypothetical protein
MLCIFDYFKDDLSGDLLVVAFCATLVLTTLGAAFPSRSRAIQTAAMLIGGAGNDTFIFGTGYGAERVEDFAAGGGVGDVIRVIGFGTAFDTFTEIIVAAAEVGADTVINLGGGNAITLVGVAMTALVADDFVFG